MFYEQAISALNGNRSEGWLQVAKVLNMSVDELQTKLYHQSLTFEECILLTRNARSPELLTYVLGLFNSDFGFLNQLKNTAHRTRSSRLN